MCSIFYLVDKLIKSIIVISFISIGLHLIHLQITA